MAKQIKTKVEEVKPRVINKIATEKSMVNDFREFLAKTNKNEMPSNSKQAFVKWFMNHGFRKHLYVPDFNKMSEKVDDHFTKVMAEHHEKRKKELDAITDKNKKVAEISKNNINLRRENVLRSIHSRNIAKKVFEVKKS